MRIVAIRERTLPISRYADPRLPTGDLNTSAVAIVTDVVRDGKPVIGFGFSSIGRFAQPGLIRERFAPRLLAAQELDPVKAWDHMMTGEKPGGHGERSVAVGTLDMALWDAAAKIHGLPLYRYLQERFGGAQTAPQVPVYAGGGYYFPDTTSVASKTRSAVCSTSSFKIKIGGRPLSDDLRRIEAVLSLLPSRRLAVDAMNRYSREGALAAARALEPFQLRWFEDLSDPLDFETQREIASCYARPIGIGEPTFSASDARNLIRYAGLRPDRDVLLFDPAHCYGLPEYLRIIRLFEDAGWNRGAFQPHGGHLYSLHLAAGLGLGGSEASEGIFQPFGGFSDGARVVDGFISPPEVPGIGFESRAGLIRLFRALATIS